MTVILVLSMFLVFALVDWLLSRHEAKQMVMENRPALEPAVVVEGFSTPQALQYHPGHGWLMRERKHLARVGADEFAAALLGKIERIELPRPGQWIRQGQNAWGFWRNGQKTEMVSPTEGEVVEINAEVVKDPTLVRKDPYGAGWLMTIHVPDEEGTARNLVPKSLVPNWMRDAAERLYARQAMLAGAVAADGGRPIEDIGAALPAEDWKKLTAEFFLT
jgi:glycine cleavage system H protein